jgi:histidyl-tRNA synthetase
VGQWQFIEGKAAEMCRIFGYQEIRTPVFEHTELFLRGVGEVTDIVSKEMYTFQDRGDRSLTLRPEGTAPVARSYLEHKLYGEVQPVKVYYIGPMFRYDRPQAGRYRQFHQFGVEVFGANDPTVDADVMVLSLKFFRGLGLSDVTLQINSVGCPACRSEYRTLLQEQLRENVSGLCVDCTDRYEKNPLRILDCKNERCRELTEHVPMMTDNLCEECAVHFTAVKQAMDKLGEPYIVNPRLVRGLDYYTKTAFEITSSVLGAQSSIGGGGRYDHLLSAIGGPEIPGIGFAIGLERVLLAMEAEKVKIPVINTLDAFVATAGDVGADEALAVTMMLRDAGIAADKDYLGRSLKAQLKFADKKGVRFLIILGDEELKLGMATVRDMKTGTQQSVSMTGLTAHLTALVKEAK